MEPIVTVYAFNDNYAELAAVSMTSLVYNMKRDCDIHIFESSVSKDTIGKILKLEEMFKNAKITIHHISDKMFEEVADNLYGKESWYPMLAPEILCDLDKALVLEPDTLICRDISELYDMDLGDCYAAVNTHAPTIAEYDLTFPYFIRGQHSRLNAGVMLYNLKAIREKDLFNLQNLIETVKVIRPFLPKWLAQQSYQSYILDREHLKYFECKYNSHFYKSFYNFYFDLRFDFDEVYEAVNNPAIIHFINDKPNVVLNNNNCDFRFLKWWEYLAISPFANPEKDKERLESFIKHTKRFRDAALSIEDYHKYCLFDDMMEATEKLKEFTAADMKILVYGAGEIGCKFIRFVRIMKGTVDRVCDLLKCGQNIDGTKIESTEILKDLRDNWVVVIAIKEPKVWSDVFNKLTAIGFPEKHILPICEPWAAGGRRWSEVLQSIKV